jgi:hypothetical protein
MTQRQRITTTLLLPGYVRRPITIHQVHMPLAVRAAQIQNAIAAAGGRVNYAAIGRAVGLSPTRVRQIVNKISERR